jgi:hypothetical protein
MFVDLHVINMSYIAMYMIISLCKRWQEFVTSRNRKIEVINDECEKILSPDQI